MIPKDLTYPTQTLLELAGIRKVQILSNPDDKLRKYETVSTAN
jgi:hypothetical protein